MTTLTEQVDALLKQWRDPAVIDYTFTRGEAADELEPLVRDLRDRLLALQQENEALKASATEVAELNQSNLMQIMELANKNTALEAEQARLTKEIMDGIDALIEANDDSPADLISGIKLLELTCNAEHERAIQVEAEQARLTKELTIAPECAECGTEIPDNADVRCVDCVTSWKARAEAAEAACRDEQEKAR